jgi:hypothetical protein
MRIAEFSMAIKPFRTEDMDKSISVSMLNVNQKQLLIIHDQMSKKTTLDAF